MTLTPYFSFRKLRFWSLSCRSAAITSGFSIMSKTFWASAWRFSNVWRTSSLLVTNSKNKLFIYVNNRSANYASKYWYKFSSFSKYPGLSERMCKLLLAIHASTAAKVFERVEGGRKIRLWETMPMNSWMHGHGIAHGVDWWRKESINSFADAWNSLSSRCE